MPSNFLVGCAEKYACKGSSCYPVTSANDTQGFCGPMDGHTLSPWVRVRFTNEGGREITVGNLSSPENNNLSVIKSFEFGGSDGIEVSVTIHDQQGGDFAKFMENLVSDAKCLAPTGVRMAFEWGWIRTDCPGDMAPVKSPTHYAIPETIECNFSGGKFMFTITGTDMGTKMFEGRNKETFGGNGDEMCLEDAITEIFTTGKGPTVKSVRFRNKDLHEGICWEKQECGECLTATGGSVVGVAKGPKGVWEGGNRDKLQIVNDWLSKDGKTINNRGCKVSYNSEVEGGEIIVQEDPKPAPGESRNWNKLCIGTYIVNGGYRSSVIEFNPRVNWQFSALNAGTGGDMGTNRAGSADGTGGEIKGDPRAETTSVPYVEGVGAEMSSAPSINAEEREVENAEIDVREAQVLHGKALNLIHDVIEADLVIIGDPLLPSPIDMNHIKTIGIVFINPYHLVNREEFNSVAASNSRVETSNSCGDWLAEPTCNEILSNKAWFVKQVNHKISPGSYTTTLRIYLTAPGVNLNCYEPVGGLGSQGWKPKCCPSDSNVNGSTAPKLSPGSPD